ncbi:MAG: hypothetical protein F6K36_18700 [Symploca sp. SIO3C6]|uniref:Uncharacterized protein n=1 Tax=Symploca sp. SIO1C4 TaxID=2607765 RepID=A0A6B3N4J3_9CYAN|nr:hypothetical protein [Symploca sp. SIO3C6]NER26487.1 hypothetical protein [Symploca sp. SIO1C4]
MTKLTFSTLSKKKLKQFIQFQEFGTTAYPWTEVDSIPLDEREERQTQEITSRLLNYQTHLMNEATIWARGIYPLLVLAEQQDIQAWAEVSLKAQYPKFELEVIADGVLGKSATGFIESPFLVVVEAKKGVEAENPLFQLYGQILAAAHLNWENDNQEPQEIFGCYTIADSWTFLRGEVEGIDSELPTLRVEYSREYVEKLEAQTILRILKGVVAKHLN